MSTRLVLIDPKSLTYSAFSGRTKLNSIKSDRPLDAQYVEYFRKHTEALMKTLVDQTDPEVA